MAFEKSMGWAGCIRTIQKLCNLRNGAKLWLYVKINPDIDKSAITESTGSLHNISGKLDSKKSLNS